jgi:hypothetical protein
MVKTVLVFLFVISYIAFGQSPSQPTPQVNPGPQSPPPPQPLPMTLVKKSVVFIQSTYARRSPADRCFDSENKPSDTCSIIGTGFLLFYPDTRVGEGGGFSYLVTNKHMVREPDLAGTLGKGKFLQTTSIRINTKKPLQEGGVSFSLGEVPVTYSNGDLYALVDPIDPQVDLAIINISLNPETLDFFMIQPSLFATKELIKDKKLDESNEVMFAGLFAPFIGNFRNYPIVRHGKLAMMSEERIPWQPGVTEDLFLADVMSFGGNSGSPVFIRTGGDSQVIGNINYYLLGVMQGFYSTDSKVSVQTAELNGVAKENTGVAAVVPAEKISEILESPRAVSRRDLEVAKLLEEKGNLKEAIELYKTAIDRLTKFDKYHADLILAKVAYAAVLEKSGDKAGGAREKMEANAIKRPEPQADDDKK